MTDLKTKLMRETMGTLGVLLLNLGKQTGIMDALRGGDKLSTSETYEGEEVETENVVAFSKKFPNWTCFVVRRALYQVRGVGEVSRGVVQGRRAARIHAAPLQ